MRELKLNEIEQVNGGFLPAVIIAVRVGQLLYKAVKAVAVGTAVAGAGVVGNEIGKELAK